jgi:tetratricopeptide (TPR) repeat protein
MIEQSLVYIHSTKPTRRFVGCGTLVEGGYVATCRHVWRMATEGQIKAQSSEPLEVEIEYPRSFKNDTTIRSIAHLAHGCEEERGQAPDLVLLKPHDIPSGVMTLQTAAHDRFQVGNGYAIAGLRGLDQSNANTVRDIRIEGEIADHMAADGLRQFTGSNQQGFWSERGSSGSPVFVRHGQQLAGILSLSMLGANQGVSRIKEAFVVPGTTIRSYLIALVAAPVAKAKHIDLADLQPVLAALGAHDVPVAEIPDRLREFVEAARARAAEPVRASNDGADIDAVIGASREKLRALDTAGAREVLQAKIDEEEQARARRLAPLLKERASIELLALDYDTAKATFAQLTRLAPDDVWAWIELGDLWVITGRLDQAIEAYRGAESAARRTRIERDLSVSQTRIGDVLRSQGDRTLSRH